MIITVKIYIRIGTPPLKEQLYLMTRTISRPLLRMATVLCLAGLTGCGAGMRYVFTTSHDTQQTPGEAGLAYEDVRFSAKDGVRLHGWLIPGEAGKPLVVFFHGNAANISHRVENLLDLHQMGLSVFIFDYRGYGSSDGQALSEDDIYQDARGALDHLAGRGWRRDNLIYFGRSMGAAVALQMALEEPPAGLVLESPFTSLREIAWQMTPITYALVGWWGVGGAFDNLGKIGTFSGPLLIFHGDRDPIVPLSMSRRLFAEAREPKTLHVVHGAAHSDAFRAGGPDYRKAWLGFLSGLSSRVPLQPEQGASLSGE